MGVKDTIAGWEDKIRERGMDVGEQVPSRLY
jgi:hypothetical protein